MSNEGGTEQTPRGNFLQRFIKRTLDKVVVTPTHQSREIQSDFESQLFRNGTLDFDLNQYMAEATRDLQRSKDWYGHNPYWDAKKTAGSMARDMNDAKYEMIWKSRFSGQIPKYWYIWYNVIGDFEKARRLNARLSETLIDAGVSHPHHLVAYEVGKGQRLNTRQLAWLFVRPDFPDLNRDEIITAQRKMGVSEKELQVAIKMADQVCSEARRRGSGVYTPGDTSNHLETKKLPDKRGK